MVNFFLRCVPDRVRTQVPGHQRGRAGAEVHQRERDPAAAEAHPGLAEAVLP